MVVMDQYFILLFLRRFLILNNLYIRLTLKVPQVCEVLLDSEGGESHLGRPVPTLLHDF
jgi:hypothetical protein